MFYSFSFSNKPHIPTLNLRQAGPSAESPHPLSSPGTRWRSPKSLEMILAPASAARLSSPGETPPPNCLAGALTLQSAQSQHHNHLVPSPSLPPDSGQPEGTGYVCRVLQ